MRKNRIEVNLEVNARYVCPLCSYETQDTDEMVNHMVTVHGENEEEVHDELVDEVYSQFQLVGSDFWLGK
jgi:hypothetical protein